MKNIYTLFLIALIAASCTDQNDDAQYVVDQARIAAGNDKLDMAQVEFEFRDREYGVKRQNGKYEMVRLFKDSLDVIRDQVTNEGFQREVNGTVTEVPDSMAFKYTNSINSVIYFALLPYNLNDAAVIKSHLGTEAIKDKEYYKIKVTFEQEGGGKDFEDEFIYWVAKDTYFIDYLAYSYLTDGGGMRFREAYNPRTVNGIRALDYINYKPKTDVKLEAIGKAFEAGELEELSRIELVNFNVELL
ncbi:DUF6503 family protein [Fulvivirga lutimaris]|uniref:DUF6503 family protein n=1 Tax=Fulvivirga lutimaris TaxID=1819566 RepID=UPI0012BB5CFD|nr:DUF6503 family protein [Fulvivirga lutimaris]MTI39579.1 hypothetical protein [Fulvivirga lutimaris]